MSLSDPILWVELLMLSALLTAGICAAWTDLRFQRVPNRYTLGLLGIGVAGQIAMAGLGVGGWNQVAGILLLGLGVALLLMLAGAWSPGDANMYWAAVAALKQVRSFLVGFIASEEGVKKQALLPVAWVGAVLMAAAVVLSMPEKAHASVCWGAWHCDSESAYFCKGNCQNVCPSQNSGWDCVRYGSGPYRCKCW